MWHADFMRLRMQLVQLLAAVLFVLQVPLHLQHEMLSCQDMTAKHIQVMEKDHHHSGDTDAPEGRHQNHDCACCMPALQDVPVALSLSEVRMVSVDRPEQSVHPHTQSMLSPTARDPPLT